MSTVLSRRATIAQSTAARFAPRAAARLATITPGPLGLRKTMSTPPTITTATGVTATTSGTTGSTLTAPVNYPYNTVGKWRTLGGVDATTSTSGNYAYNGTSGPIAVANNYIAAYSKQFIHRGQALEVAWRAVKAGAQGYGIRIAADGQWIG